MLRRRLYYAVKPYLPWRFRVALRRIAAQRKRRHATEIWPVYPPAARSVRNWPGWPEGRKFAFVLTHDTEGPKGLAKIPRLAELEASLGFHSSYNLIPEGPYQVPADLRRNLERTGFEVGVHDLHHDGDLYQSRAAFRQHARSINGHLKEWGATGFRSGFMFHELDWIHDLNIKYDCSTFDTDPFEPQSDGAGTIFPFWVPPPRDQAGRPGYVELPYSLAQDSTLFLILRERTPDIWLRKLDWVAEHGGMALVNVHPDYLCFEDERPSPDTFPIEHYTDLLKHVRDRYAGAFWQPLPRELAAWYEKDVLPRSRPGPVAINGTALAHLPPKADLSAKPAKLRGKRAAVLLYSYYPSDSRPRRAAQAMIEAGMTVDLLCLSENPREAPRERIDGVNVFRVPMAHTRGSKVAYALNYLRFFARSFTWMLRRSWRHRYDIVHVHNMPDFLVFASAAERLRGTGVILDLHDPMPELMTTIYRLDPGNWQLKVLRALERWSIRFANVVLTPNIAFRTLFNSRCCPPGKMQIIMNCPEAIFDPARYPQRIRRPDDGQFRIMHHGSIVHRHGLDLMIEAAAKIRGEIPGLHVDIYGRREGFIDVVLDKAKALGIGDIVHYHGNKSAEQIAQAILETDLGIIPNRRSVFTEINFPTRIFEFLAMGRLVVAPATQGISDYFSPADLPLYEQNNVADMAEKILWVHNQPEAARAMLARGQQIYRSHLWVEEESRFLDLVAESVRSR